jgi:hypothetical protein
MTCTIMQPAYLPWLGYFERILMSDVFIVLDHVDIDRNSKTKFANRNRIRTKEGWTWLTAPVVTKGVSSLRLCDLQFDVTASWQQKHLASIQHAYSKTAHYQPHIEFIHDIYQRPWQHLAPMCDAILDGLLAAFDIRTPVLRSSQMHIPGQKDELIRNHCLAVGADTYISGPFGRNYLDLPAFAAAGIQVRFHDYQHPEYSQTYPGFEPYMSAIDLLFNHGPESRRILQTSAPLATT